VAIADVQPSTTGQQLAAEQRQQQGSHLLSQAQQLLQMQNVTEALSIVEQALQVVPQDIAALTLKGQILGTLGRFPEALTVVEQLTQLDPKKALTWSMRAVVLTNLGHYQPALAAIERSLELDAHNPETQAIKRNILEQLATATVQERSQTRQQADSLSKKRGGPLSFFIGVMLQIAGVVLGAVGGALLVLPNLPGITLPGPPVGVALGLESFGLALLCVNAARGAYRYGILRLLVVLLMCLVAAALLGAAYEIGHTRLMAGIIAHPPLLVPLLFAAVWLAVAATLPLILAIGGYIGGLVVRVRRRSS
jgi:tetratricopeptide (TPR) repeat protein